MAVTQGDGSIILSTKVDTKGVTTGLSSIKSAVGKIGAAIGIAFSARAIINFSREAGELATQQEASVQRLIDIYGQASESIGNYIDTNARALGMSKSAAASFASVYGNLFSVWADQASNAELTKKYLNMTAVVASKTGRTVEDVQERVRSGLLGNTKAIDDLGIFVNVKTIEMTDAFQRMANGRSWEQLDANSQQQIRTMAILEQATAKYGTEVADTTAIVRLQYSAAYEDFKATWGQVVNKVLIPVLKVATLIFDMLTAGLRAIAGLSGKTVETVEQTSSSSEQTAENINKQADGQKKLNKELKKSLAGFDDLMILADKTADAGDAGDVGGNNLQIPVISGEDGAQDTGKMQEIASVIKSTLADILEAASGALLAIGLLMLFSGNVLGGLGFIMAGGAAYIAGDFLGSENPVEKLKKHLATIEEYLVPGLLAIGVLLLFFGMIPLGIGLIIGGIAYWGYKEVQSSEYDTASLQDKINVIMEAVSLGLVAIGVLLIFFGVIPLGIGLVVAGKALLNATEEKLDEGGVTTKLQRFVEENSAIIMGVGIALVVIALIMFACGIVSPLSLGLLVAGGAALVAIEEMNPGYLKETITNFLKENEETIVGVAMCLIVLGIILLMTGVGIPLAIGLIVAGAAALAAEVAVNWNYFSDKLSEMWEAVKSFWNTYIAPIFTKEWWLNLAKAAGNGLISGFEGAINGVITMFENMINWIVEKVNTLSFDVPDWVPGIGGKKFGFNLQKVKFNRVKIPRLAQGAVIPANREFLAVLGDQKQGVNIEAPLQTIVDAFNIALANNGSTSGNTTVVLEIDGREFGHAVIEQGKRESKRLGTRMVMA